LSRCFIQNTIVLNINAEEIDKLELRFDRVCLTRHVLAKELS